MMRFLARTEHVEQVFVRHAFRFFLGRNETIGDLGGRLRLGHQYINYPSYGNTGHRTLANLYLSFLEAVGERRETFGIADSGLADLDQIGPLTEILV